MQWLSSPRVRLGLVVNGLYFLSLFSPPPPPARAGLYARANERPAGRLRSSGAPAYAPLPPQSGPLKVETHHWPGSDRLDVYLTGELLLVRRRGHTLLLSPTLARPFNSEQTPPVLLHFSSFAHEQLYDRDSPFVVTADGVELWRHGSRGPGDATPPHARALHTAALDGDGQVVETLGHELPPDIFLQLTSARRVTFELGADNVELSPEQLNALRDMGRHLRRTTPTEPGLDYVPYSYSKRNY
jgi:hypothetical protein